MTEKKERTIKMTDHPPIVIKEDDWPIIAQTRLFDHDGEVECQANRKSHWRLTVRQHKDGRVIVYAMYHYSTAFRNERDHACYAGIAEERSDPEHIVSAIKRVAELMAEQLHQGNDAVAWDKIGRDCIANLPPVRIE